MPDKKPEQEYKRLTTDDLRDYVDKMLDFLTKKYLAEHPIKEKDAKKKEKSDG